MIQNNARYDKIKLPIVAILFFNLRKMYRTIHKHDTFEIGVRIFHVHCLKIEYAVKYEIL